jgi:hypothetical protein
VAYRIIYDTNDKELFKFHIGTVLDRIIPDLWNDITKYMNYIFGIGLTLNTYSNYRPITKIEFGECKNKFFDYYSANDGLVNLLDKIGTYLYYNLTIDECYVFSKHGNAIDISMVNNGEPIQIRGDGEPFELGDFSEISDRKSNYKTVTIMVPKIL